MPEQEITLKNTKAEILDALNSALARAEAAENGRLNTERQEKEKVERKVVASAEKSVEQEIFSKELIQKFKDLQAAIVVQENRLQELYGVGKELQKLALAVEAGKERIAEIEKEKQMKEDAAQSSLKKLRDDYAQKQAELQADYDQNMKKIKTERDREADEFKYNLTRTRSKEDNAWADEKLRREAELQKRETRAAELLAEAESKTAYVQSLEEKVKTFPGLIEAEKKAAVTAASDVLNKEHSHQSELLEMDRKSAIARLEDKVKYLEKELLASTKSVDVLQGKLDKAYSEMRDLAAKTVESYGGVKIIGGAEKVNA